MLLLGIVKEPREHERADSSYAHVLVVQSFGNEIIELS